MKRTQTLHRSEYSYCVASLIDGQLVVKVYLLDGTVADAFNLTVFIPDPTNTTTTDIDTPFPLQMVVIIIAGVGVVLIVIVLIIKKKK
ncbi:MAG: hypothetical protein RTV72_12025 [Candidatus Thorarchaeota archaeon]